MVPVKRLIMPTRNNAELTFEPQFAPPQCILWAIFGGFPGFLRVPGSVIFFPINAPGMGRFQLLNLGGLGYGLELRFWVVIAIIVSLTLTITLITTLTII